MPVKLGFIILSIIGVLRIPEEFYLYKDNDKDLESKYLSKLPVKVQIKFAKALLGVNKQAVNLAVLGELGMYPISIHAFKSATEYWLHIHTSEDTLLYKAYETNSFATRIKILFNKLHLG